MAESDNQFMPLDASDVDRWIGKPLGGNHLRDPIAPNDIRRWTQAMQNPNPLFFDADFAAESAIGKLVGSPSFTVATTVGHGATPAIQGTIPGSHMLFGGDEWWFFGPRIAAGDRIVSERMAFDYKVTNTKFAGPTMFQRGDTTYINQNDGSLIARQRSTSIRYIVENAHKLNSLKDLEKEPVWAEDDLARVDEEKMAYYKTFNQHVLRRFSDVEVAETLPMGVIGPHTLQSFTTEYRAFIGHAWGAAYSDGLPTSTDQAGWLPEMAADKEKAKIDPAKADGLFHGPSRGHVQEKYARLIGMPRAYGYGATMGGWVLDYVGNWVGELGGIVHGNIQYRNPALAGDVTYLRGKVTGKAMEASGASGIVTVAVEMTTQAGAVMAKGVLENRLPI